MNMLFSESYSKIRLNPPHRRNSSCSSTPKYKDCLNTVKNSQDLLLFGRTILHNQSQYKGVWTEKQHEKEIQELLLRKERGLLATRKMSKSTTDLLNEDESLTFAEDINKKAWEDDEAFLLLKEVANYLKSSQEWLKALEDLDKGQLFMFPKEPSEILDLIEKTIEDNKATYNKERAEIEMLEKENMKLKTKLKKTTNLFNNAIAKIAQLEGELKAAKIELHNRAKLIQKQNNKLEERATAFNADYIKLKEMLELALKEKETLLNPNKLLDSNKEKNIKKNYFQRFPEKPITNVLIGQSCGTETIEFHKSAPKLIGIKSIMLIPQVQFLVVTMLKSEELLVTFKTSKILYECFTKNSKVTSHLLQRVMNYVKARILALENKVEMLRYDDKRFSFLKEIDATSNPEFINLVNEYICKRKVIGAALIEPLMNARNFIRNGEIGKVDTGGWNLNSIIKQSQENISVKEVEKAAVILDAITTGAKGLQPETICDTLNKVATRIGTYYPDRMSRWINQLQLCFGMLFKGTAEFYVEAKNGEKLKNFLIDRLDQLKQKLINTKKHNEDMIIEIKNFKEVLLII